MLGCRTQLVTPVISRRDDIVEMAKQEIERRHIQLPRDCDIKVVDGVYVTSVEKKREEYFVLFSFAHGGKREVVYKVDIDKRSRKVIDFVDYRNGH
jgi:hypothetical protein